jgi:OOP family OmpA-OmpF porin
MMMSKRTGWAVGLGLTLSMASAASWAEGGGWYFGVTGGQAEADLSQAELDDIVLDGFSSVGFVLDGSSTLDDSDTSFSLFGGYRFSQYLAVEAGYVDFGTAEYRASGVIDPFGPQAAVPATYSADFEVAGFTATAIGAVPIGAMFDVHGRAGILFADTELTEAAAIATSSDRASTSASSQDFFYGLGVGLQVGQNWSFSLDWQQFKDVGDDDETGESDVNRLSLGVIYKL